MRTLGGLVLGATAFIACPCHLVVTAPLLLVVLGGTSAGALLTDNPALLYVTGGVYFVAALVGALWLLDRRSAGPAAPGALGEATEGEGACCPPAAGRLAARAARPGGEAGYA